MCYIKYIISEVKKGGSDKYNIPLVGVVVPRSVVGDVNDPCVASNEEKEIFLNHQFKLESKKVKFGISDVFHPD